MNIQDALNLLGLPRNSTTDDIKKAYRKACKSYHPDINPAGAQTMKAINNAYDALKDYTYDENRTWNGIEDLGYGAKFNRVLRHLMKLEGLTLEVCGSWIWVTGNTKSHKDKLKAYTFQFAPKKQAWYFRPKGKRSRGRGQWSMGEIRGKYGSSRVEEEKQRQLS